MQPPWLSFVEAVTNIVVGYALAVLTQMIVFPLFGLQAPRDAPTALHP
jgi:hypothetical protein